jgi:hypothetical protein
MDGSYFNNSIHSSGGESGIRDFVGENSKENN